MARIVLPFTAAHVGAIPSLYVVHAITAADIRVAIEVVIHIDVDVITSPTAPPAPAAASPCSADCHSHTEGDRTRCNYCSGRIWWVVNRWVWIDRRTINNRRVVRGNINNLRT